MHKKEPEKDNNNGHRLRLRKRFLANGRQALADHEILELILHYAIPRKDTKDLAKLLLEKYESLNRLVSIPPEEIMHEKQVGESVATLFKLIHETKIYLLENDLKEKKSISNPKDLIPLMQAMVRDLKKEVFIIIALNPQNHVLDHKIIHEGTVDQAVVYIREIVEFCLFKKATRVIAVHNHPSGVPKPSGADHLITQKLKDALKLMDMELLDHIIIADNNHYSFQENRQL